MKIVELISIGISTSLIASIFFIILLSYLKPNLKISPYIAKRHDTRGDNAYFFKIVNKSWFFKAFDIWVELLLIEPFIVEGGTNIRATEIKLKHQNAWCIDSRRSREFATYAHLYYTNENIEELWDSERKNLELRVMAKHQLSGFKRVFVQKYYVKHHSIKNGSFKYGNHITIV
ncbi:hypothetical protein HYS72_00245 [Candidatus Pacearchaeota archaeon]|nr:hypothetical protein [Candidatus Pacearchaeota archaeon]